MNYRKFFLTPDFFQTNQTFSAKKPTKFLTLTHCIFRTLRVSSPFRDFSLIHGMFPHSSKYIVHV